MIYYILFADGKKKHEQQIRCRKYLQSKLNTHQRKSRTLKSESTDAHARAREHTHTHHTRTHTHTHVHTHAHTHTHTYTRKIDEERQTNGQAETERQTEYS